MESTEQATVTRHKGTVKWFNNVKGYGFIASDTALPDKADVFVHYSGIAAKGYRTLAEGQEVEFAVEDGAKGPQATALIITSGELPNRKFKKDNNEE
jgi:CspA family cold shock protein